MKIYVVYHKPARLIKNRMLIPIHAGRAISNIDNKDGRVNGKFLCWLNKHMIGDDTGDNISILNRNYCELTALYWAWKNSILSSNEMIGLMHYRRVFDFGNDNVSNYKPSRAKIRNCVSGYDVILPKPKKCWTPSLKINTKNVFEHFKAEHGEFYTHILEQVFAKDENFQDSANYILYGTEAISWYNIIIAKREIFNDYCTWLFRILAKIEEKCLEKIPKDDLNVSRMMGFFGEILLNIYFHKKIKEKKLKVKYLPDIKLEEETPDSIVDNSIQGTIKKLIKRTGHAEDFKNLYLFLKFLRQKRRREKWCGGTANCVHSLTYRNYFPNAGAGGGGAVLSCQKILLGNNFLGRKLKYSFFEENKYSNKAKYKELWDLWGAIQFAIDKTAKEKNTVYITHDYATAFGLYLLGKRYVLNSHIQGSRVQEKKNFNEKFSKITEFIIKYCEKKSIENAFYMCYPSYGSYSYFVDSEYTNVNIKKVTLGPVLYNTLYAFPKPETCPKIKEDRTFITFFSSGQATLAKGIDQTLSLIECIVKSTTKKIRWIYVGVGPLLPKIIERCAAMMKKYKNFIFSHMGSCTYAQAAYLYRISDYYIMLHRISIFDLCTLEAMYHCKAVILSNVGGNAEFNIDDNIFYVDSDYELVARRILNLNYRNLGWKNRQIFDNVFSQKNFILRYKKLILNLINGNKRYIEYPDLLFESDKVYINRVASEHKINSPVQSPVESKKTSDISVYEIAKDLWECYGATNRLLDLASNVIKKTRLIDEDHRSWLIFLSALIERKEFDLADKLLREYINVYKEWDIYRYLLVSDYVYSKSIIVNDLVKDSSILLNHLKNNLRLKVFQNILKDKTVAIIGNGPSEKGRRLGQEIDKHEIVIRFNNYNVLGYEEDYGTRTDIWVRGSGASDVINRENVLEYKLIVLEADYLHYPIIPKGHPEILVKYINRGCTLTNFDHDVHFSLKKASGIEFPTSGLVTVWYIYNLYKRGIIKDFDIYGFAFRQVSQDNIAHHYFNDRTIEVAIDRSKVHNLSDESKFILQLMKSK